LELALSRDFGQERARCMDQALREFTPYPVFSEDAFVVRTAWLDHAVQGFCRDIHLTGLGFGILCLQTAFDNLFPSPDLSFDA
jgi:hypothetical protein